MIENHRPQERFPSLPQRVRNLAGALANFVGDDCGSTPAASGRRWAWCVPWVNV